MIFLFDISFQKEVSLCSLKTLYQYGLRGRIFPRQYSEMLHDMPSNMCPSIKYSCCAYTDYERIVILWEDKKQEMQHYIRQLFKSTEQINQLQSSLVMILTQVRKSKSPKCQQINFNAFNNSFPNKSVYHYLSNAFQTFAFLQKGFYCMICDANTTQYIQKSKNKEKVNIYSYGFCKQLIFFFREYIMFKVFHLDTLMENMLLLDECYYDAYNIERTSEFKRFDRDYKQNMQEFQKCLYEGIDCEFICQNYKIGSVTDIFIGDLTEMNGVISTMKQLMKVFSNRNKLDELNQSLDDDDLQVDDKQYEPDFFIYNLPDIQRDPSYDLGFIQSIIEYDGLNQFEYAIQSNLYLQNFDENESWLDVIENYNQPKDYDPYKNTKKPLPNSNLETENIDKDKEENNLDEKHEDIVLDELKQQQKILIPNEQELEKIEEKSELMETQQKYKTSNNDDKLENSELSSKFTNLINNNL